MFRVDLSDGFYYDELLLPSDKMVYFQNMGIVVIVNGDDRVHVSIELPGQMLIKNGIMMRIALSLDELEKLCSGDISPISQFI